MAPTPASLFFRPLGDQRGMALLVTLLTVSLLVAVTVQYHKKAWHNLAVSNTFKESARLQTVAGSGVNIALALLAGDTGESDNLTESWATTASFAGLFPQADLELRVIDLSGRLPVNSLVVQPGGGNRTEQQRIAAAWQEVLLRLLQSGSFAIEDDNQARAVVDALIDWLDADEQEMTQGAESGYYQGLPRPYRSRNGPVDNLAELLLVKGVTPALLYGEGEQLALVEYLSPYGEEGKINLNTADPLLLQSLHPEIDADLAAAVDDFRREEQHADLLGELDWYRRVPGWPAGLQLNEKILTSGSGYFRIEAEATFNRLSGRQVVEVLRKEGGEINFLRKMVE